MDATTEAAGWTGWTEDEIVTAWLRKGGISVSPEQRMELVVAVSHPRRVLEERLKAQGSHTECLTTEPWQVRDHTVKMARKMRRKGATYKEIADALNQSETPTFSGKGRWYAQTVHRLIRGV